MKSTIDGNNLQKGMKRNIIACQNKDRQKLWAPANKTDSLYTLCDNMMSGISIDKMQFK